MIYWGNTVDSNGSSSLTVAKNEEEVVQTCKQTLQLMHRIQFIR
jgi:hypothetical protein